MSIGFEQRGTIPGIHNHNHKRDTMTFKIVSLAIEAIRGLSSSSNSPELHAKIERAIIALNDLENSLCETEPPPIHARYKDGRLIWAEHAEPPRVTDGGYDDFL